jgi:hypothetical protein
MKLSGKKKTQGKTPKLVPFVLKTFLKDNKKEEYTDLGDKAILGLIIQNTNLQFKLLNDSKSSFPMIKLKSHFLSFR